MEKLVKSWLSNPLAVKIVIAIAGFIVIRIIVALLTRSMGRYAKDSQTRYRARKVVVLISYLVILLFLGIVFKDRLGGLAIAFGVAGAGVAFALQEVIVSLAGWVAIVFGRFFVTGDRIQLGGIKGDVIDIGLLRTTLMECGEWIKADLYTGRIVRVANSFVFKEPVFNYSGDFPFLWDEITVPVTYTSDYRQAREILEGIIHEVIAEYSAYAKRAWKDVVKKYMVDTAMIDPVVTLALTDNWIEFTVRYITDYKLRRATRNHVFSLILERFAATEGKVEIASGTYQLVNPPPFQVQITGPKEGPDHPNP
jgi:small-conductance mechanosensitive channel